MYVHGTCIGGCGDVRLCTVWGDVCDRVMCVCETGDVIVCVMGPGVCVCVCVEERVYVRF